MVKNDDLQSHFIDPRGNAEWTRLAKDGIISREDWKKAGFSESEYYSYAGGAGYWGNDHEFRYSRMTKNEFDELWIHRVRALDGSNDADSVSIKKLEQGGG